MINKDNNFKEKNKNNASGENADNDGCIGCKLCYSVCPQKCIDISKIPVEIDQNPLSSLWKMCGNLSCSGNYEERTIIGERTG